MKYWLPLLFLIQVLAASQNGLAAEASPSVPAAATEKAIPPGYSEEHYANTWSRNPFLIIVIPGPENPRPSFAEDWELHGLTRSKGQPEALLGNKKTQEFRWVKTTEDNAGFKLLKANIDRDLHQSSVEVAKAGESSPATFKFPEVATAGQPVRKTDVLSGQHGAVPRTNPTVAKPNVPGHRRVLIPATPPAAGKPAS